VADEKKYLRAILKETRESMTASLAARFPHEFNPHFSAPISIAILRQ